MGGASWDAERVLSILADVATAAAIIAILIAAVQFIGEAKRRKEEFERLELARQEQAFEVITTRPSFAEAWQALDNHETNDRGFMAYVNARIDLALEGAHGTRH